MRIFFGKKDNKNTTTVVLTDTKDFAIQRVARTLGITGYIRNMMTVNEIFGVHDEFSALLSLDKLEMNKCYKATTVCDERDIYNKNEGVRIARDKAVTNLTTAANKAIKRWQVAMLKKIRDVDPEIFKEALEKVTTSSENK